MQGEIRSWSLVVSITAHSDDASRAAAPPPALVGNRPLVSSHHPVTASPCAALHDDTVTTATPMPDTPGGALQPPRSNASTTDPIDDGEGATADPTAGASARNSPPTTQEDGPAAAEAEAVAFLTFQVTRNRFCRRIGRAHRSNHVFITAAVRLLDPRAAAAWWSQGCWDPECRGFRSAPTALPERVADETAAALRRWHHHRRRTTTAGGVTATSLAAATMMTTDPRGGDPPNNAPPNPEAALMVITAEQRARIERNRRSALARRAGAAQ